MLLLLLGFGFILTSGNTLWLNVKRELCIALQEIGVFVISPSPVIVYKKVCTQRSSSSAASRSDCSLSTVFPKRRDSRDDMVVLKGRRAKRSGGVKGKQKMSGKRSPSRSEQSLFSHSAPNPIIFHHVRQLIPSPILTQI